MKRYVVLLVAMICPAAGCDSRSDLEKLQGQWHLYAMNGNFTLGLGSAKADGPFITFEDKKFTVEYQEDSDGPGAKQSGTFTCDTAKSPKQITFVFAGRTVVAIYRFVPGGLQICVGEGDKAPPTSFDGGPGSRPALLIFERSQKPR